jgi:type I restriction enzyme R subunit
MTPAQKARQRIDQQLAACGWAVQNYGALDLSAGLGVAVREFPLQGGFASSPLAVHNRLAGSRK